MSHFQSLAISIIIGEQMINIIDHAWQFELKNYEIFPTVIKFTNNPPKCYFYSKKNSRILRKKDQSLQASIQFLNNTQNPYQNYLLVSQLSNTKIQFQLILQSQLFDLLNNQQKNLAIIQLQELQDEALIVQCSFDLKGKANIKYLMQYDRSRLLWSNNHKKQIATNIMQSYMLSLWKEFPQLMKTKSKCKRIELLLSTNSSFDKIYMLWCNQLLFQSQEFYQIHYQYTIKQISFDKVPEKKSNKIIQPINQIQKCSQQKRVPEIKNELSWTQSQGLTSAVCNGCGCQFEEQKGKQVQNSDVIALRRRKRLSIMGVLAQYLLICEQCYHSIDQ